MFVTHCVMRWIVLAVLSLSRPVWSVVKVIQPYRVVSTNGTAQVQCFIQPRPSYQQIQPLDDQSVSYPYPDPEELRVTLLKGLHGTQELCSSVLSFTDQKDTRVEEGEVQCSAQMRRGAVDVTVSGLNPTDTDIYRCEIEVFYPPPYLQLIGNGTLIHVLDSSECPVQGTQGQVSHLSGEEEDDDDEKAAPVSFPVVVLVVLVIVALAIIVSFQVIQSKQVKRETVRPGPAVLHKVDAVAFSCGNFA